MTGRSSTKGVYVRDGVAYIRYQDEHGGDVRESTKQRSAKVAEDKRGEDALIAQCIPTDTKYPEFLVWRRARLSEEINGLLGAEIQA